MKHETAHTQCTVGGAYSSHDPISANYWLWESYLLISLTLIIYLRTAPGRYITAGLNPEHSSKFLNLLTCVYIVYSRVVCKLYSVHLLVQCTLPCTPSLLVQCTLRYLRVPVQLHCILLCTPACTIPCKYLCVHCILTCTPSLLVQCRLYTAVYTPILWRDHKRPIILMETILSTHSWLCKK